jgi:hypothetical protein
MGLVRFVSRVFWSISLTVLAENSKRRKQSEGLELKGTPTRMKKVGHTQHNDGGSYALEMLDSVVPRCLHLSG